nr:leucine-rich repeat protein [Lachnospiraceae bacterium]
IAEGGTASGDLIIPAEIDGKAVTVIGDSAFSRCEGFSGDLIIPDSVTTIGKYAFYDCKNFTGSLTIPDNVRKIDEYAFCYCSGFNGNLTLGNSLTTISDNAFFDCSGFTGDLIIPDSVTTIGAGAFDSCVYFTTLTLGNSVETIGEGAFFYADVFTGGLTIPDSVKQIGKDAFKCCNFPGGLTLGSSVETIGESAFYQCGFTGDLIIPDSVTTIGEGAFYQCGFTGDLTIGNGVTTIGEGAFSGCSGFTGDLIIGNSVETIGNTFADCRGFTGSLTIGNSVKTIDKDAFKNCKFTGDLTIGNSVETIGEGAFYDCKFTGNLTIPGRVTTIGKQAFYQCSGFKGKLTIPDRVTTIGYQAFYKCGFDGSLTLGGSVETIGDFAFQDCGFKGNLIIPDKATMIGEQAFYRCGFDGNLTIPDSVTTIGKKAFYQCGFTGGLIIPDSVKTIDDQAFRECGFDGNLTLGDNVKTIGPYAFRECGFTGSLIIPDSVTTISNGAFENCGFDGNLVIGNGIKTISDNAFSNCANFGGSLTIPANVTLFGYNAFFNCNGFRKIINASNARYTLPSVEGKTWKNAETGAEIPGGSTLRQGVAIRSDYYDPVDAPYFTHDPVGEQTYTGKAIKPAISVYFGTRRLEEKTDYTIAYANNTNAGMASFTVTGKGNYAEKDSDSFVILKKKLTDADVIVTELAVAKYTKKEQIPVPKITYNGMTLKKGKDFELTYFSDAYLTEWCIPKEPGKYYVKITGIGNYEGEKKIPFVIANPNKKLMSTLKADKIPDQPYNNGIPVTLDATKLILRDGKTPLTEGTEYEVVGYIDNTLPGTARVTVRGIDTAGYTGTLTVTFKIKGTPINKATITGPADTTYDGTEQKPVPQLKYNDTPLSEGNDYELVYEKNINAGKAKVTIKGKGGYTGSVSKTFTIKPATVTADMITIDATYPYTGSGVKPVPTVKLGETTLKEGKDYTVKYANNSAITTAATTKRPTVSITGKGNFTGKADKTFTITAANINTCKVVVDDVIYKDKNGNWKPKKVTVYGTDRKALKKTDYEIQGYKYKGGDKDGQPVGQEDKVGAGTEIEVTVIGKGSYTGTASGTFRIVAQDISKLTATLDPKAYTGKAVKLNKGDIKWKSGGKFVNDVTFDFDESSYKNNVNKGKATVIVKGTGNYGGTKTITFTIGSKGILWWWRNLFN